MCHMVLLFSNNALVHVAYDTRRNRYSIQLCPSSCTPMMMVIGMQLVFFARTQPHSPMVPVTLLAKSMYLPRKQQGTAEVKGHGLRS